MIAALVMSLRMLAIVTVFVTVPEVANALAVANTCNYLLVEHSPIRAVIQTRGESGTIREWKFEFELEVADGKDDDQIFQISADGTGKVESLTVYQWRDGGWQGKAVPDAAGVSLPVMYCVIRGRRK